MEEFVKGWGKVYKLQFIGLFETYKQIKFVGTGVLDGPRIT